MDSFRLELHDDLGLSLEDDVRLLQLSLLLLLDESVSLLSDVGLLDDDDENDDDDDFVVELEPCEFSFESLELRMSFILGGLETVLLVLPLACR